MILTGMSQSVLVVAQNREQGDRIKAFLNKSRYYDVEVVDRLNPATRLLRNRVFDYSVFVISAFRTNVLQYMQRLHESGETRVLGVVESGDLRIEEALKGYPRLDVLVRPTTYREVVDCLASEVVESVTEPSAKNISAF